MLDLIRTIRISTGDFFRFDFNGTWAQSPWFGFLCLFGVCKCNFIDWELPVIVIFINRELPVVVSKPPSRNKNAISQ